MTAGGSTEHTVASLDARSQAAARGARCADSVGTRGLLPVKVRAEPAYWQCTVRDGAGLRPALAVTVWACRPALRASGQCTLSLSVVWVTAPAPPTPDYATPAATVQSQRAREIRIGLAHARALTQQRLEAEAAAKIHATEHTHMQVRAPALPQLPP